MKRPSINELSLREKIAQLLMIQQYSLLQKCEVDETLPRSTEEMLSIMEKYQYGSLWGCGNMNLNNANMAEINIGHKTNTTEYKRWIEMVSAPVKLPMLIGMDCENGAGRIFSDATDTSAPLSIGAANSEKLAYELGAAVAREMKAAGGNWRWTPILDVPNRFNGVGVGRSYSDEPERLARLSVATMKGIQSENVAATAKHFPGCDPYEFRDSHIVTTIINLSMEEWEKTQGKLFQELIEEGVYSVMIGHTAFPAADDTMLNGRYIPATFSKRVINGLLREKMKFEGVVITDGITMAGLTSMCSYEEMLIRLINAGNDVILGVNPYDSEVIYKAVEDGKIPIERINESCERVLKLKEKLGLFQPEKEAIDIRDEVFKTQEIDQQIAEKSITLVCDKKNQIPLRADKIKNVAIVCSSHLNSTVSELKIMQEEFEKRGAIVKMIGHIHEKESVKKLAQDNDLIIYAAYVAAHRPMGMPSLYGEQMETYFNAFSYGKEKSIGVSMGYPYLYHDAMAGVDTFFNIYSTNPASLKAFVKTLYGEIPVSRSSPIDITPKLRYVYC